MSDYINQEFERLRNDVERRIQLGYSRGWLRHNRKTANSLLVEISKELDIPKIRDLEFRKSYHENQIKSITEHIRFVDITSFRFCVKWFLDVLLENVQDLQVPDELRRYCGFLPIDQLLTLCDQQYFSPYEYIGIKCSIYQEILMIVNMIFNTEIYFRDSDRIVKLKEQNEAIDRFFNLTLDKYNQRLTESMSILENLDIDELKATLVDLEEKMEVISDFISCLNRNISIVQRRSSRHTNEDVERYISDCQSIFSRWRYNTLVKPVDF